MHYSGAEAMKTEIRIKRNTVRNTAGGFTLVELLVVIAIIALLLSVMMPALQKARTVAQGSVCSNNMGQLYVVQNTFASGNDGKFPHHGGNLANFHHIDSAWRAYRDGHPFNPDYRVDIYNSYKSYIGNSNIFVCPITTKFAPPNGKTLGYYKSAKWREPKQTTGWWYGGWEAQFYFSDGALGEIVRMSPYWFFAAWEPKGMVVKVFDPLQPEPNPTLFAYVKNKDDKWATSQFDIKKSSPFIAHEIIAENGTMLDRGHGGLVNGPRVNNLSLVTRAGASPNPVAFGDGSASRVPTSKVKLRAWYYEAAGKLKELYW